MDKIVIKGLRIFAFHGVNSEEKEKGQPFVLDVALFLPLSTPGRTDNLTDTVNYAHAVKAIKRAMLAESYDLLERAAEQVARTLLEEFPTIIKADVCLQKPRAPIAADFDFVGVEISRTRGEVLP